MKYVTILLLLLSISHIAKALECYACRDCQLDFKDKKLGIITEICPRNPQDRHDKLVRCSKHVEKEGKINRGCSTVRDCSLRELISKCSENTLATEVIEASCETCCEGDRCNSATMVTAGPVLFVLSVILALYQM